MSRRTEPHPEDIRAERRIAGWLALTPQERAERAAAFAPVWDKTYQIFLRAADFDVVAWLNEPDA